MRPPARPAPHSSPERGVTSGPGPSRDKKPQKVRDASQKRGDGAPAALSAKDGWVCRLASPGSARTVLSSRWGRQLLPGGHSHPRTASAGGREWLRFQDSEYKFFEPHATWAQAQRICMWFQAELASVHSQAELDFLGHNLQKVGTRGSRGLQRGGGQAGSRREPTLPCSLGFPSSREVRSSTGGSVCTRHRVMGASGKRGKGQQVWEGVQPQAGDREEATWHTETDGSGFGSSSTLWWLCSFEQVT